MQRTLDGSVGSPTLVDIKGTAVAVLAIGAYLLFTGNLGVLTGTGALTDPGDAPQAVVLNMKRIAVCEAAGRFRMAEVSRLAFF